MDVNDLRGAAVIEAGVRQAWPFLTFAWPDRDGECRLHIDTTFRLDAEDHRYDDPERAATALLTLVNLTATEAAVDEERRLTVRFDGDRVLVVAGAAAEFTTQDVWWFGAR